MSRELTRQILSSVAIATLASFSVAAPPPPQARTAATTTPVLPLKEANVDLVGDPLPAGAIARMGSIRLRHANATDIVAMPDGKTLVTSGRDLRFWETSTGRLVRTIPVASLRSNDSVTCLARSGDGRVLAAGHADNRIRLWDVQSGKELWASEVPTQEAGGRRLIFMNALRMIGMSANAKVILSAADSDNLLRVWDGATGRETGQLRPPPGLFLQAFALSEDGRIAAGLLHDLEQRRDSLTRAVLWDVASGALLRPDMKIEGPIRALALSRDGTKLALGEDESLFVLSVEKGGEIWRRKTTPNGSPGVRMMRRIHFTPDGRAVVGIGHGDSTAAVGVWDVASGEGQSQWTHADIPTASCILPDSKTLATVAGATIRLWDTSTGRELLEKNDHPQNVGALAVSQDGRLVVSSGHGERSLRIWEVATGKEIRRCMGLDVGSDEVGISHDGQYAAACERGGAIRVWNVATGQLLRTINAGNEATLLRFTIEGLGTAPYTSSGPSAVRVWNCASGAVIREPREPVPFGLAALLASVDGRLFAVERKMADGRNRGSALDNFVFRSWEGGDERGIRTFRGHTGALLTAVVSADGRTLATRANDNSIRLWETATGGERLRIDHANHFLTCTQNLAISADGRTVAAADQVGTTVVVWDTATGRRIADFAGHSEQLIAMEFTPDGRRLVSGSYDGTLLVWDVEAARRDIAHEKRTFAESALARYWDDLQGSDASQAYRAYLDLQDSPIQAIALFRHRLRPETPPDPARIDRFIRDLDSPKYVIRENAERELRAVVYYAEGALRNELAKTKSAEVRRRANRLMDAFANLSDSPKYLREQRVVEVLESLRTPESKQLLSELVREHGENYLGRQAKAALRRLELTLQ
ncbi:MAG: WD40 repeat domain-containing protein [Gemmataceae bacterium]